MNSRRVTPLDVVALLLFSAISVIVVISAYKTTLYEAETVVISTPYGESVYSIHSDREVMAKGSLGDTLISIKNGEVTILSSPCKEKTCMYHPIAKTGESLVCLPNGVVVQLQSISGKRRGEELEVSF